MEPDQRPEPYDDPLIDEVRQRRKDLLADYDNDLDKFFAALRKMQDEHPEKIIRRPASRTQRS